MYFTTLPGVTILLQVYHHTVLNDSALVHNPLTSTSPYSTLRLCPGSQSFYKYITILYFTSLPGVTILLRTSPFYILRICPGSQSFYNYITILHFTIPHCPGSQSFYKYITILYFTSLPGVTILLQVQHHTVLYVSARGQNPSTSTSPYSTIRLSPGSQSLYKYITILYFTTLPGVIITLQVHHHTILNVSVHITILYVMSLPGVTIILQVDHHTVLDVSARGHNPSTSTSPCCTLGLCPGSQSFYKYITILYFTSLPWVTIILQVHHDTVFYVSAWSHNHSASTYPYCTLHLCPGPQSFYKYITILCFTSLPGGSQSFCK